MLCVVFLSKLVKSENRFSGIDIVLLFHYIASYNSTSRLPGFALDHCSIIISISAFYFLENIF